MLIDMNENNREDRFMTRAEVEKRCGMTTSALYRLMRAGEFREPFRIGPRAVRWSAAEIEKWCATRPRSHGESRDAA